MPVLHLDRGSFAKLVNQTEKAVLIDFWAPWCGPCRKLGPELEKLAEEHPELVVGKVDVTEHGDLAAELGIDTIPALFFYRDGKMARKLIGYLDKDALAAQLQL